MNCLIYLRVSTKEQAEKGFNEEGLSIPAQREACVKHIQEKGLTLIDEYIDRGESARSAHRPQLQEMLSRIRKDKTIDAVVVHKIDRFSRNMEDHMAIRTILKKHKVALVSVVENIEDSASGRLIEGIHALMAEFYSANLGMETKKGMRQKAKQGGWPNLAPLGYINKKEIVKGRIMTWIEPDPDRAPIIKEAFRLYATGNFSVEELRDIVTEKGLRTLANRKWSSRPISKSNLARLLQNRIYIGMVEWDGIVVKGSHEPLIDKDTFEQVQQIMRIRRQGEIRKRKHHHFLKGTLYCGECKSRLSIAMAREHAYFYCLGQKRGNGCKQKYMDAEKLEKAVENLYQTIQLPDEWVQKLKNHFEEEMLKKNEVRIEEQNLLTKRMTKLVQERKKLMQAYYSEAISLDMLKEEQERITKEMTQTEQGLNVASYKVEHIQEVCDFAIKLCSSCHFAYTKAKPDIKKMFNRVIFNRIYVKNRDLVDEEFTEPLGSFFNKCLNTDALAQLDMLCSNTEDIIKLVKVFK